MTTAPTTSTNSDDTNETNDRTYGNWQHPPRGGMLNLGNMGTMAGAAVLVVTILTFMFAGLLVGIIVLIVGASITALFSIQNRDRRSLFDRLSIRLSFRSSRKNKRNLHRAALTPPGTTTLPGLLGKVTVTEHLDLLGHPFALIAWPGDYYTVAWSSSPDGAVGSDNIEKDTMVAYFGEWLSKQASVPGLIGSSVIIETAPDTGGQLGRHIESAEKSWAPPLAKAVMREIAQTYPEGSANYRAYVTMTFTPKDRLAKTRNRAERIEAMAASLAADLPGLVSDLAHSGAGTLIPMDVQTLCEQVRVAYDPAVSADVEQARAAGVSVEAMTWTDAGPMAYQAHWDHLLHDSGASVTYGMTSPPRQNITADVMAKLLAPSTAFGRKRIALVYRVMPEEKAGIAAENGVSNAMFARNASKKKTAKLDAAVVAAERTAAEEARGAGIADFTIYATVTVLDQPTIGRAATSLRNLAGTSKLRVRKLFGWQDAAFVMTLPLGMQVDRHASGPKFIEFFKGE